MCTPVQPGRAMSIVLSVPSIRQDRGRGRRGWGGGGSGGGRVRRKGGVVGGGGGRVCPHG